MADTEKVIEIVYIFFCNFPELYFFLTGMNSEEILIFCIWRIPFHSLKISFSPNVKIRDILLEKLLDPGVDVGEIIPFLFEKSIVSSLVETRNILFFDQSP